jgi:non-homologous end joining protein Ku
MKKYVNGKYIKLTEEEILTINKENSEENRISAIVDLKQKLSDTDYIACKIAEGVATKE